jgi:hypothetical protein
MATVEEVNPTGGARAWGGSSRLSYKPQTADDRYSQPENFLEVEVLNPKVHGEGRNRYVDYEVRLKVRPTLARPCLLPLARAMPLTHAGGRAAQTNLPAYKKQESSVRRVRASCWVARCSASCIDPPQPPWRTALPAVQRL